MYFQRERNSEKKAEEVCSNFNAGEAFFFFPQTAFLSIIPPQLLHVSVPHSRLLPRSIFPIALLPPPLISSSGRTAIRLIG